jgi:hypothetical protein
VLQMVKDPRTADLPTSHERSKFMQCRLPAAQYEWLRYRAFVDRRSMNSMVLGAIAALRDVSPDVAVPLPLTLSTPGAGSVKFNVHLSEQIYEWLRTKAFTSRGSINQLLINSLHEYRAQLEQSFQRPANGMGKDPHRP